MYKARSNKNRISLNFNLFNELLKNKTLGCYSLHISNFLKNLTPHIYINKKTYNILPYGFIVFSYGVYSSDNIYDSLLKYASLGISCVLYTDTLNQDNSLYKKIEKLKSISNVMVCELDNSKFYSPIELLKSALTVLDTEYVIFLTASSKLNPRSYIDRIKTIVENNKNFNLFLNKNDFAKFKNFLEDNSNIDSYNFYWSMSSLSTSIFKKNVLLEILDKTSNDICCKQLFLPQLILNNFLQEKVYFYDEDLLHKYIQPRNISEECIAIFSYICIYPLFQKDVSKEIVNQSLGKLLVPVSNIISSCNLTSKIRATMFFVVSYALFLAELHNISVEDWKEKFFVALDFCHKINNKDVKNYFNDLVDQIITKESSRVFIIENYGMDDIKQSVFFQKISEMYEIDYQLKLANFDYYHLNNLVIKIHSKAAQLTISSGSLSKDMLNEGDNHLTLWHGLGWMKKTEVKPKMFSVGTIVCSSKYCEQRYKEHFYADNSIGLGSVQTDKLYDDSFIRNCREQVCLKYGIPNNSKIMFFAPTFRLGDDYQYYDFGIDIEMLSKELEKQNIYLITKRHHIIDAVKRDKGIDSSGVYNSKNHHFIIDECFNFVQLVSSADCFVTDYSSGMYYAFLRNIPIFLYATDVEEYRNGRNGFEIDYPADVPVPFVSSNSIDEFMQGYFDSFNYPHTEKYQLYKRNNIGACDGFVAERVLDYIRNNYFKDL